MKPDIVYVVRPGPNEELRYSLRSLSNLPHGKVWIAGYCPSWVTGVEVIPVTTKPGGHQSAKANLQAACEHPKVSEEFVYFNDDFFVMQPQESMPILHRGTITEAIASVMQRGYTRAMKATRQVLVEKGIDEPLCYELHAPTLVTKSGMLEALALCRPRADGSFGFPMGQERSIYGNLNAIGGDKARNYKAYRGDYGWRTWPFISTNDHGFDRYPVGEYIRATFKDPSPYETGPVPHRSAPPINTIRQVRRPVRYSAVSRIGRVSARAAVVR